MQVKCVLAKNNIPATKQRVEKLVENDCQSAATNLLDDNLVSSGSNDDEKKSLVSVEYRFEICNYNHPGTDFKMIFLPGDIEIHFWSESTTPIAHSTMPEENIIETVVPGGGHPSTILSLEAGDCMSFHKPGFLNPLSEKSFAKIEIFRTAVADENNFQELFASGDHGSRKEARCHAYASEEIYTKLNQNSILTFESKIVREDRMMKTKSAKKGTKKRGGNELQNAAIRNPLDHFTKKCSKKNMKISLQDDCSTNSDRPSQEPSQRPSGQSSISPSSGSIIYPSTHPSGTPSKDPPSDLPSDRNSRIPSKVPGHSKKCSKKSKNCDTSSYRPSQEPSHRPVEQTVPPSEGPGDYHSSVQPSRIPSKDPSDYPSIRPSRIPSKDPSNFPSIQPSHHPTQDPSDYPSTQPSNSPSQVPSHRPSLLPSNQPSLSPTQSQHPTSENPSAQPSTSTRPSFVIDPEEFLLLSTGAFLGQGDQINESDDYNETVSSISYRVQYNVTTKASLISLNPVQHFVSNVHCAYSNDEGAIKILLEGYFIDRSAFLDLFPLQATLAVDGNLFG